MDSSVSQADLDGPNRKRQEMERSASSLSQAHFQGPNQKRQKMDSELSLSKLSGSSLTLANCYVTEVLAFPRSLAVFRNDILHWNATCWLERFPIPQLAMRKIADHCKIPTLHKGQICEFKGSERSNEEFSDIPEIRLLVVFPHMKKSFDSEEVQKRWTDETVLPSIYRHVISGIRQYLPTSYQLLRLNSQVKRMELGLDVRDTPSCVSFRSDSLERTWTDIMSKAQESGFEEFAGAFLVALGQWHPTYTIGNSTEEAWRSLGSAWDTEMDMTYIPAETFEVRMESQFRLAPTV
ncbi:hypothetical protein V490_02754 [Pseudogymnoascus sp. VKM F-3557]|nr:hypothetical protein V490_02754 [Pseudogymnoascus sp. VKM F-3557]